MPSEVIRRNARLTIGELARRVGVGVETVRYYQRRGLFPEPAPIVPRVERAARAESLAPAERWRLFDAEHV